MSPKNTQSLIQTCKDTGYPDTCCPEVAAAHGVQTEPGHCTKTAYWVVVDRKKVHLHQKIFRNEKKNSKICNF